MKRIEKLNNLFLTYMCGKDPNEADEAAAPGTARPASSEDAPRPGSESRKKKTKRS